MIQKLKNDEKLPVYGDGKNVRDWIHVQDHCEAIDEVLHNGRDGEVYNIGGEDERRNIDIVRIISKTLDSSKSCIVHIEDRKGHDWRYAMDISKIKNELEWYPKINFEEGMGELLK